MTHTPILLPCVQGTKEWLEIRKSGIGGSDAAAVMGLNKYRSPYSVWQEKRGELPDQEDNWFMARGRAMEPAIRQHYADYTGKDVLIPKGILQHPQYTHMMASLDGYTECDGYRRGFEAKTTRIRDAWGEPGTDEIPQEYAIQVHHAMIVTGMPVFDASVEVMGEEPEIYTVEADKEIHEFIVESEREFWDKVKRGIAPEAINEEDVKSLFPKSNGGEIEADDTLFDAVQDLKATKSRIKELKEHEDSVKAVIMAEMKDNETLLYGGSRLVTWKSAKPSQRLDTKTLKADLPDIYKAYTKEGAPQRRFLIK